MAWRISVEMSFCFEELKKVWYDSNVLRGQQYPSLPGIGECVCACVSACMCTYVCTYVCVGARISQTNYHTHTHTSHVSLQIYV